MYYSDDILAQIHIPVLQPSVDAESDPKLIHYSIQSTEVNSLRVNLSEASLLTKYLWLSTDTGWRSLTQQQPRLIIACQN